MSEIRQLPWLRHVRASSQLFLIHVELFPNEIDINENMGTYDVTLVETLWAIWFSAVTFVTKTSFNSHKRRKPPG